MDYITLCKTISGYGNFNINGIKNLTDIENAKVVPSLKTICKISKALGVDIINCNYKV